MTDSLSRAITLSGNILGLACDTTDLVNTACRRHDLGPTAAAALGRALTGATLLAALLKNEQSVQLLFEGNGPLEKVVAEAGASGWCRGYVQSPRAHVPLKNGQIDVAAGIGRAGFLRVVKDIGGKEKYSGLVQLYTSEVGEDIAYYLTESEQTPSAVGLGVQLMADGKISAAGGFLIQSLPPADEAQITELERNIKSQQSITSLLIAGQTPVDILDRLFQNTPHKITGTTPISFSCRCSREKMKNVLATLSQDDIDYLLENSTTIDISCDYCSEIYRLDEQSIRPQPTAK